MTRFHNIVCKMRPLILLDNVPKTLQIVSIQNLGSAYRIVFVNNPKAYTYGAGKVEFVYNAEWVSPSLCRIYKEGSLLCEYVNIWKFTHDEQVFWRIEYRNGSIAEYSDNQIDVVRSCLDEQKSKDVFAYMKSIAALNPIGSDKGEGGLLSKQYERIDFIGNNTAVACYFNPTQCKIKKREKPKELIFPFGTNTCQKKAVLSAFENQISIIQGPPGTGKTQTILNIIANIVLQGKTVMVVSNNNSATANVQEKLEKHGLGFIVATLGKTENKEKFIKNQSLVPEEFTEQSVDKQQISLLKDRLHDILQELDKVYTLQNELAKLKQELHDLELEWKHFCSEEATAENIEVGVRLKSSDILSMLLKFQNLADSTIKPTNNLFMKTAYRLRLSILYKVYCRKLKIQDKSTFRTPAIPIKELQRLYYPIRHNEVSNLITQKKTQLSAHNAEELTNKLTEISFLLFKSALKERYSNLSATIYTNINEIKANPKSFLQRYPVVLSTTFSARSCVFDDTLYDYVIMDEASQISPETGALALTCASNAVVVGDAMQLPNIVSSEDAAKITAIMKQYRIADAYNCATHSFLQSVASVMTNVSQTLLREHYRCHPRIINFCNQKFYGGNLLIMTDDNNEENVLCAIKTVQGNHAINQYNQREIDVIKQEILPCLKNFDSIGIVTPYNHQVNEFQRQLPNIEAATIHKYQGREKDVIIMSLVDNQITQFADDPNLINVAVSRAKKRFYLVMTGNPQKHSDNITDLLDYVNYNECTITESKVASIFDYLYEQYTLRRISFLRYNPKVSEYASENLTYSLIQKVLNSSEKYGCLKVLCHIPLQQIIRDTSLMSAEELQYASNSNTHVDFLIVNRVNKKPVIGIETDGYAFHNDKTKQYERDLRKNHIFELYNIPLIRFSTKGSGEEAKLKQVLDTAISRLMGAI